MTEPAPFCLPQVHPLTTNALPPHLKYRGQMSPSGLCCRSGIAESSAHEHPSPQKAVAHPLTKTRNFRRKTTIFFIQNCETELLRGVPPWVRLHSCPPPPPKALFGTAGPIETPRSRLQLPTLQSEKLSTTYTRGCLRHIAFGPGDCGQECWRRPVPSRPPFAGAIFRQCANHTAKRCSAIISSDAGKPIRSCRWRTITSWPGYVVSWVPWGEGHEVGGMPKQKGHRGS